MKSIAAIALVSTLLAAGPALAETRTIDLPPFTAVSISSGIDATIVVGGTQSVEAEAPNAGILDDLKIRVENGELHAWVDWSIFDLFDFGRDAEITLRIAVPAITGAEASSGSDVEVTGAAGDRLSFEASSGAGLKVIAVSGTGTIDAEASNGAGLTINGTCTSASIEASSGASIDAKALLCADVTAEASSGADAAIYASASVKAEASSGADVVVHGSPARTEVESSSGGNVNTAN